MSEGSVLDQGAPAADPAPVEAPAEGGAEGGAPSEFNLQDHLPDDLRDNPTLKNFKDVQTLAKSYVHAQGMIGKDKVVIPDFAKASKEEIQEFYHKMGQPKELAQYEFDLPTEDVDEEFIEEYKKVAFDLNIMPEQAKGLVDWFNEYSGRVVDQEQENTQMVMDEAVNSLRQDFGDAYDAKVAGARQVLEHFAGDQYDEYSERYGNDPSFIKMLAKMHSVIANDNVQGITQTIGRQPALSPQEAQDKISGMYKDKAYMDKFHPEHKTKVREMQQLFQYAYPTQQR